MSLSNGLTGHTRQKSWIFIYSEILNAAREVTERWMVKYNSERTHEPLNYLILEEYRMMVKKSATI
ncbi:hypothetical protein NB703_003471 [Pantoea ananatis]|jgi:putative transposase|uniref:Uncharacterized protein n=1 Tax=Pantoea ananas TaxID=553 RepID=A0AAJ1D1A5_PANAN|nr:hypothetical protein [Pantoea ananatis]MCW0339127.1 hypothetical protein [Pantoea ananatis]MCW0345378.1 hypothetical protein [Pantoea ananatis]MCW0348347.1 hypothetical protein [Pantoea ananatis]MCW0355577.1 hypothetical protein [Pantoea ananatis]